MSKYPQMEQMITFPEGRYIELVREDKHLWSVNAWGKDSDGSNILVNNTGTISKEEAQSRWYEYVDLYTYNWKGSK
jgi:hypothetical protein